MPNQTHQCETSDFLVVREVLQQIERATARVSSPNGGEIWAIGSTLNIGWSFSGLTGNVKIEVSRNGGTSWAPVISSTPNDSVHTWTVTGPATITQARIRVTSLTDPTVVGSSATLTGPSAAAALAVTGPRTEARPGPSGATRAIQWTSTGLTGNVKIEVSRNGGTSWALVDSSAANSGTFNWTVAGPATLRRASGSPA